MIKGYWHPKGSAVRLSATLLIDDLGHYSITVEDKEITLNGDISTLHISERLGNVERKITLEDGSLFTSHDNSALDEIFKHRRKVNSFVHYLETHLSWILVAFIVTLFTAFSFFKWGIPWTSEKLAHALPHETNQLIASGSMKFLDKYMFDESNISQKRQDEIRQHFNRKIAPLSEHDDNRIEYKVHFRSWEMGGSKIPNALALPSGDIIMTDKFIELSKSQDEIDSVLLHEMGHVVHRHGLEMLIEGTFITVAVMMISGDSSGLGDMGVGLGSALVSSSYSRGHESEADLYAFEKMLVAKIDPASFSHIMNRMTLYMDEENNRTNNVHENEKFLDYFSSHPSTQDRIELANRYSECFKAGLTICK